MGNVAELLDALRRFHLLDPAQLDNLARKLQGASGGRKPPVDARALAQKLIEQGWLTPYQVNQLLQGRGSQLSLGSYVLLERLGEGGMGEVFKARNWKLGKIVAIKLIRKERLANETAVKRFHREARAAAQLAHPNVVHAHDADEVGGTHIFVMEYVEGTDLNKLVKESGPLAVSQACDYIRQAALGLQHAHERGLVHRDIKPHNLVLASGGRKSPESPGANAPGSPGIVKILDFGLARIADDDSSTLTQEGSVMGTLDYLAPEQARDSHSADIRADLYALGCTFRYLLTGQVLFPGGTASEKMWKHAFEEPTPLEKLRPDVPAGVAAVIRKLLAKRPEDRFQTPAELAAVLGEPGALATGGARPGVNRVASKRRRLMFIGAGGLLALGLFGLFLALLLSAGNQSGTAKLTTDVKPAKSTELEKYLTNSLGMEFVLVPKGKSWLGGSGGNVGTKDVHISYDFYLGKYEVTQEEWEKITGANPSIFNAVAGVAKEEQKRFPVEHVSWEDCQGFIKRVNEKANNAGWVYRLPTELEWEYACRGGPLTDKAASGFDFYFEKPSNQLLPNQAAFNHVPKRTSMVGSYQANRLGLHDMHGNVWEWCDDAEKAVDGAKRRVLRGGGWSHDSGYCRATYRAVLAPSSRYYDNGLRLARVPVGKEGK